MAIKAQVRKSLGNAAYNNSTTVTFSSSTTTIGLTPGMPLTGTGISVAGPLTCGLTNTDATVTAASTTGLVVGMQVNAFTGVPAGATILSIITNTSFELSANATATDADAKLTFNTIISSVDSTTTITLSNVTTGGNLTAQTLIFEDLARVAHVNGPAQDAFVGSDALLTIATGAGAAPVLFNARRYVGNATARSITGFGFQPDMVWFKRRDSDYHGLFDSVRGATKAMWTNVGVVETTEAAMLTSLDTDGFSIGTGNTVNINNTGIIAWGWIAGGTPSGVVVGSGATMSGTSGAGSIDNAATGVLRATSISQSVSQTSGFSITAFTGHNDGVTFPHNLGGTPDVVIIKVRSASYSWFFWMSHLTADYALRLDMSNDEYSPTGTNQFMESCGRSECIWEL